MKYLHLTGKHTYHLSHKLTPEVRAMFAAMASRVPVGGLVARYTEVVEAVAEGIHDDRFSNLEVVPWSDKQPDKRAEFYPEAEDTLCEYPLHPKVQEFFDKFVGAYGHSSILELAN